ncbi:transglutaminase-like cysteine peptidase [Sulfurimonas sp.]|uniref:transglutaminase-like cysteine peptidase n=1 Tax=Sulfurimonas sp. TaxID=2022749 RepID=UPI00261AC697|nr:transglutaminase-like cysteine peptidase [Sulfurimonas sp.]MCW8895391.1 transglutaminase-like cysteine peptidase [Sulfurimonas sp.]
MKLLLFLLTNSIIYASSYPNFTKNELKKFTGHSGIITKNRVLDYAKSVDSFKKLPKQNQLISVNHYLNQLPHKTDMLNNKQSDYWETPKEFLTCGYGDCEDYAIIKYFTLLKLGFSKDKLFITTAFEKYTGQYHMVLSYFEEEDKPPLVLDNLSYKVLDLKKREDLKADIFISPAGTYKLDNFNKLIKVDKVPEKFIDLLERVKKES